MKYLQTNKVKNNIKITALFKILNHIIKFNINCKRLIPCNMNKKGKTKQNIFRVVIIIYIIFVCSKEIY